MSKVDNAQIKEQVAASIRNFSRIARDEATRQRLTIDMPDYIRQKAALISAHFLLPSGSRVVDMACETGEITYMLAVLNPRVEFIGVDRDAEAIAFARKHYRLPNLSFRLTDVSIPDLEDGSVDGIINSNVLHHAYSAGGYNPDEVSNLLERQIAKLKVGGTMVIRDYVMPPPDDMVLIEIPNVPSRGETPIEMSDADLLVAFSQTARPMVSGCEGFFIEELPPRREETRLFRLPHKWAVEFIHRKSYRADWQRELTTEYTFYGWQDYRREFSRFGMRMVFSAPHWNPWVVQNCFKGRFQLYGEDYAPRTVPATNYFIVAQKLDAQQSMVIEERRPSQKPASTLNIKVVRDTKTGKLYELVSRPGEFCDVVPYRITPDNRLIVYARSGYPRPIVNAVNRSPNLDGKKWSGHLIEPISMDTSAMTASVDDNRRQIFSHVETYAGLRPKGEDRWFVGNTYFPAPDRIDEAIEPVFIEVENPQKTVWPIVRDPNVPFTEPGRITELDAADIILSSQVGLLPEPRLEMHVLELMARHGIAPPMWLGDAMPEIERQAVKESDPDALLEELEETDFEEVSGAPVHLKSVNAVFVEEGRVGRTVRGLAAHDVEFIVGEDGVENIAVVLPLTRDWDNNLLVAVEPTMMPIPNRLGGDGAMLNAPSFPLPRNVRSIDDARAYIADKFGIPVENVVPLGQSYFVHTALTPQRIYPFVISAPIKERAPPTWRLARVKKLEKLGQFFRFSTLLMRQISRLEMMSRGSEAVGAGRDMNMAKHQDYQLALDRVEVNTRHAANFAVPSRILGQQEGLPQPAPQELKTQAKAPPHAMRRLVDSYAAAKSAMRASAASVTLAPQEPVKVLGDAVTVVADQPQKPIVQTDKPVDAKEKPARNKTGKELAATLRAPARTPPPKTATPQLDLGLHVPDKKGPR